MYLVDFQQALPSSHFVNLNWCFVGQAVHYAECYTTAFEKATQFIVILDTKHVAEKKIIISIVKFRPDF